MKYAISIIGGGAIGYVLSSYGVPLPLIVAICFGFGVGVGLVFLEIEG